MDFIILTVGFGFGLIAGYFIGKYLAYRNSDLSSNSNVLQSLSNQVLEMKTKFDAYEKLRDEKEKHNTNLYQEKEKRYEDFIESTKKFFQSQEKIREENELKRDKQIDKFSSIIDAFTRTIHGTKTRGNAGEDILREYLKELIKAKIVISPLTIEGGSVEFAWHLGDNKYIPIDAKFPDIISLIESISPDTTQGEKNKIKDNITSKVKSEIKQITKYHNKTNTINKSILVIPGSAIELCPELITLASNQNVFVCSPEQTFFIGYLISEEYEKMKDDGDLGELKNVNSSLLKILKEIFELTDTIDKQARSVIKHNNQIRDHIDEGLRLK